METQARRRWRRRAVVTSGAALLCAVGVFATASVATTRVAMPTPSRCWPVPDLCQLEVHRERRRVSSATTSRPRTTSTSSTNTRPWISRNGDSRHFRTRPRSGRPIRTSRIPSPSGPRHRQDDIDRRVPAEGSFLQRQAGRPDAGRATRRHALHHPPQRTPERDAGRDHGRRQPGDHPGGRRDGAKRFQRHESPHPRSARLAGVGLSTRPAELRSRQASVPGGERQRLAHDPAATCNYVIHIPKDHPSGTFWFTRTSTARRPSKWGAGWKAP